MANLVSELRRRNVFRVAGLYLVVSWLLLQLAAFLEDALKLPDWFDGMVTALVLLGFPVALILAWAFELTPDGVRRTAASESSAPVRPVDWVLVVLLTFVSGMLVWSRVDPPYQEGSAAPRADVGAVPKDVAVAVLPFADLSPEGDQNYFSDGLAEELLNVLRRDAGIRVAGRTSSFAFKGKGAGVQQIAESLNVTHVVEGSVRKAGERIRVSVQLINAADGFPVFSESYDRKLEDIFAVQDDIARSVGRALQLRFSLSERNPPDDVGAYEDYLTARELLYTRVVPNMVKASTLLGSAIDRAPSYAPAYATKAVATMLLSNMQGGYGERESREALAEAKTFIDRALELDPQLPDAHAALGLYLESAPGKGDPVPALTRALELDPNHTEAQLWLANAMPASKESFARLERLVDQDPAFIPAVSNLTNFYTQRAEFDRARAILTRAASVPGMKARVAPQQASLEIAAGELAKAYELAKSAYEREPGNMGAKATLGFALMMLGEFEESARVGILVNQV
ncbi:MAG: tetratricopeptide repeat protein, partial [Myxococcota bacterium]